MGGQNVQRPTSNFQPQKSFPGLDVERWTLDVSARPTDQNFMQGGAVAARETHNLEVVGASPAPASKFQTLARHRTIRTDLTSPRRAGPTAAGSIECAAPPTVFLPIDRSSTGPAVFPHRSSSRRPTPISPRCGRSRWHGRLRRATGGALLHAGVASFFAGSCGCLALLNSLHRNEPGSHAMQDCAEPLGFVRSRKIGVVHGSDHGAAGERKITEGA